MRRNVGLVLELRRALASVSSALSMPFPPAWILLVTAVVLGMTSRLLVAIAGLPGLINFVHFPLVIAAYLLGRSRTTRSSIVVYERLLVVFGLFMLASLLGSPDSSVMRAALLFPILVEPMLIILTIWHLSASGFPAGRHARRLVMILVLGQLPLALAQAASSGLGDPVQGTLLGQGAGHHVLGAVGLMVSLTALATILSKRQPPVSWTGAAAVGGFLLGVLTDFKQSIALFIMAGGFIAFRSIQGRRKARGHRSSRNPSLVGAGVVILILVVFVFATDIFAILSKEPWRYTAPLDAKGTALSAIDDSMSHNEMAYLVGLGPGTTATRLGWIAFPGAAPGGLSSLGLEPTKLAADLTAQWAANPIWLQSSISAPFSTWIGVWGDLGLLGFVTFVALWWWPWRVARDRDEGIGAQAVILFTVMLGMLFNWMEEPVLVMIAGVLVGSQTVPSESLGPRSEPRELLGATERS